MIPLKQPLPDTTVLMPIGTHRVAACTRPAEVQTRTNPRTEYWNWRQHSKPNQMLFVVITCWEREN